LEALLEKLKHTVGKLQNATRTKDPIKFLYFVKEMQGILLEIGDKLELKNPVWLRTCVDQLLKDYLYPESQKNEQRVLKLFRNVKDLNLSVRSMNCLYRENINYIIDLVRMGELDLLRIPNFGRRSLTEIKEKLTQISLRLGMQIQGSPSKDIDEAIKSLARSVEEQVPQSLAEKDYRGRLYSEPIKVTQETFVKLLRRVDELDLSVRSANCLRDLKVIYLGDLVHKKEYELFRTRNFGRRSLSELKEKLEEMGLSLGMNVAQWPPQNMKETLQHFALKLEQERTREAKELRQRLEAKIENLEDELLHHLSSLAGSKRDTQIVSEYFGWDGQGIKTLETIGRQFGITRERVRQICGKFEKKFYRSRRRKTIHLPFFDSALQFVIEHLPSSADELESELANQGISGGNFRLEGIITAAKLLGREPPFRIVKLQKNRFVVLPKGVKALKLILKFAKKSVEHWGVATVSDVAAQVTQTINQAIDNGLVLSVLPSFNDLNWLDDSKEWFWLSSPLRKRNSLLNRTKKILSVAHSIDVSELRSGISRCSRMEGFAPPRRVLFELCRKVPWCQVKGTTIVADPPFDWENILAGTTEWAMAAVLKEYGPVMSRRAFEERCLELGM